MFSETDAKKCERLVEKYYRDRKSPKALYRDLIRKYLRTGYRVLDAGCGCNMAICKELADSAWVTGIDLEPVLQTDNEHSPFGVRGDLAQVPFPSNSFDMLVSHSVIEHLEEPSQVFREFYRILRPGGKVILLTPNKYDYVSLIAAITPYWLHRKLVTKLFAVTESDVFPTLYRANSVRSIRKALRSAGLIERELGTVNLYPAYLTFSPVLFRLGILYERFTSLDWFRNLRSSIFCVFEKPFNE